MCRSRFLTWTVAFFFLASCHAISTGESNELSAEAVTQLIRSAASGESLSSDSQQAIKQLKQLGLDKHVLPLLKDRANTQEAIRRQLEATRVLQRSEYTESLDTLGQCLSMNPWHSYGQKIEADDYWRLKRALIATIYKLTGDASPVDDASSNEAIAAAIPPTLRYVSARKPAGARQVALPADDPRNNIQIKLHVDKKEWLLGEPVLLHYEAKNLGDEPVLVSFGGDYHTWAGRPLRFKVIVIDEAGNLVDDPNPSRNCRGGFGGGSNLGLGETHWAYVALWRSCAILNPGTYKIRVYHDLGWDGNHYFSKIVATHPPLKSHFAPVLETTLTFREPTEAEARELVARMLDMPKNPDYTMGGRAGSFGDMAALIQRIYLPILLEFIEQGRHECLTAIGAMPYPKATAALIALTKNDEPKVREMAIKELLSRLPHASLFAKRRRWLAERAWRDTHRKPALELGWQLLGNQQRESQLQGSTILSACGLAEDMPRYLEIFDQTIEHYRNDPVEQDSYLRPAQACNSLLGTGDELLERGAAPPATADSPAEGLIMLKAMARDESFRPDGWQKTVASLLQHPIPFVRAVTLDMIPSAEAHRFEDLLIRLLNDKNTPVQAAACHVAAKLELPAAAEPLLKVLQNATNTWLIGDAYDAATKCGVTPDRVTEICIQRLGEPARQLADSSELQRKLFGLLLNILDRKNGGGGESQVDWSATKKLQPRWQKLLESNRPHIAAGGRLTIGKPPVTHELFPHGYHLRLDDGSQWPDWSKIE